MSKPITLLACLALLGGLGTDALAHDPHESDAKEWVFRSQVALHVYEVDEKNKSTLLGTTPTQDGAGVRLPQKGRWIVQPVQKLRTDEGLAQVAREVERQEIPGLSVGPYGKVTDEGIAHLAGLTSLRYLSLASTKVTAKGVAHLRGLTKLEVLSLRSCFKIDDTALAHVARISSLKSLDLGNCQKITKTGMAHLTDLPNLEELDLW